jgi:hypothetical protein
VYVSRSHSHRARHSHRWGHRRRVVGEDRRRAHHHARRRCLPRQHSGRTVGVQACLRTLHLAAVRCNDGPHDLQHVSARRNSLQLVERVEGSNPSRPIDNRLQIGIFVSDEIRRNAARVNIRLLTLASTSEKTRASASEPNTPEHVANPKLQVQIEPLIAHASLDASVRHAVKRAGATEAGTWRCTNVSARAARPRGCRSAVIRRADARAAERAHSARLDRMEP